jgi:hypothetical protein
MKLSRTKGDMIMAFRRVSGDENLFQHETINRDENLSLKKPPSNVNGEADQANKKQPSAIQQSLEEVAPKQLENTESPGQNEKKNEDEPAQPTLESVLPKQSGSSEFPGPNGMKNEDELPQSAPESVLPKQSGSTESPGPNGKKNGDEPAESAPESAKSTGRTISPRKLAANRRNGRKSPGPKTARGKRNSSWNSRKHGLLSRRLVELDDQTAEQFAHLLASLRQDLQPVGVLEELLVEKIAHAYWQSAVASYHEKQLLRESYLFTYGKDTVMRYAAMHNRQLFQAIKELERLQRLRRGDDDSPDTINVR